jgi:hypothetical protein
MTSSKATKKAPASKAVKKTKVIAKPKAKKPKIQRTTTIVQAVAEAKKDIPSAGKKRLPRKNRTNKLSKKAGKKATHNKKK